MCSAEAISKYGESIGQTAQAYGDARQSAALASTREDQAGINAKDALYRGRSTEHDFRRRVAQFAGTQRAALAANGIDPNSGTALLIQRDAREASELEATRIRTNAAREAFGFRREAAFARYERRLAKSAAKQALVDGTLELLALGLEGSGGEGEEDLLTSGGDESSGGPFGMSGGNFFGF